MVYDEADHEPVDEIFNRVLFPLLDELLRPPVFARDPQGMTETRLRASALLCKSFMHFEVRDNRPQVDIRLLWIQVLDLLDRLMNIDKRDQLVSLSLVCKGMTLTCIGLLSARSDSRVLEECHPRDERSPDLGATFVRGST